MLQGNKPATEMTVADIVQGYEDAFDETPKGAKPAEGAAAQTVAPGPASPLAQPKDPVTGKFIKSEPTPPKHTGYWLRKAAEVGLTDDEVAAMQPDELRQAVTVEVQSRAADRATPTPNQVPMTPEPEAPIDVDKLDLDPGLTKFLKSVMARFDQLDAREGARSRQAVLNKLDARFNQNPDVFGKGATADLDPNSVEFARREQVTMGLEYLSITNKRTTLAKDFDRFAKPFLGAKPATPKPAAVEPSEEVVTPKNRVAEWNDSGMEQPTHLNKPKLPKGTAAAKEVFKNGMAQVEAHQREFGEADENDELPG